MTQAPEVRLLTEANASVFGVSLSPVSKGAAGNGVANDSAALAATLTATAAGGVIDLGGKTYKLGSTWSINKTITLRNGSLISSDDRVVSVSAANVRFENVTVTRTGTRTANSGALVWNGANGLLVDVTAVSNIGEGLRMGNGTCDGTRIVRGYYESSDTNESFGIQWLSGATHNYDVKISHAKVRNTGYGTGIGLYNCSRTTVEHCDVRNIRRSPWFTATGWSLVSGAVYRALDRTDVESNAVYVNDVEYRKNADPNTTTPALNFYTVPGDGYLYINTGVDPSTQTVKTTRTNGYGILFYATSSEALGMSDNLMAHNYVEDTDGFGLYYQTLQNVPRNNRTLQNTLRNVCLTGVTVGDLPFAGIGVFGGLDVMLEGDLIDGAGSALTPAPGVKFKQSVGVPNMTGSLHNVTVKNGKGDGVVLAPGTWGLTNVRTDDNAGSGITHGTVVAGDLLNATLTGCFSNGNAVNGVHFETTTTAELRPQIFGGRYVDNTVRNVAVVRCRDVELWGFFSKGAGNIGVYVAGNNLRVKIGDIHLGSGVGVQVLAGIAELTVGDITHDGSAGQKINIAGPYRVRGITGGPGEYVSPAGSPEGVLTAAVGSRCFRQDGGAGTTFYVKETGAGNTGWVAK